MIQAEVVAVVIGILVQDRDGGGSIVPTVPEIVKLLPLVQRIRSVEDGSQLFPIHHELQLSY